ncbi:unnamed protein product [Caenorhabditis angaria]|uniref:ZZ-type domain-containing protein n=1 Tax=Caenorhabditis angaria TaxID=860376 RepID=A0A9P1IPE3_9PELO|nr:unnamed protein product [Caenorhabditis angaria]
MDNSNLPLIGNGLPYCAVTAEIYVRRKLIKTARLAPSLNGCINEVIAHMRNVEKIEVADLALYVITSIDSAEVEVTSAAEFFHRCMSSYHCGNGLVKVYFMERQKQQPKTLEVIPMGWTSQRQSEDQKMEQLQEATIEETKKALQILSKQTITNIRKQSEVIRQSLADAKEDYEFVIRGYQQQLEEYQQKLSKSTVALKANPVGGLKKGYAHSATCDECDDSITGRRFKCLVCPDYDLCSKCEAEGLHSHHALLRTTHPRETIVPIYVREGMAKIRKELRCPRVPSPDFTRSSSRKIKHSTIPRVDQLKTPKLFAPNEMLAKLQLAEKALENYRVQKLEEQKQKSFEQQLVTLKETCLRSLKAPLVEVKTAANPINDINMAALTKAVEQISVDHKILHDALVVKKADVPKKIEVEDGDESDSSSIISLETSENEMLAKVQLAEKALENYRVAKLEEQKQKSFEQQLVTLKETCLRSLKAPLVEVKTAANPINDINMASLTKAVEQISVDHKILHDALVKKAEVPKKIEVEDGDESDSSSIISLDSIEDFEDDEIEESRQVLPEPISTAIEPTDEEEGLHTAVAPTPEPAQFQEADGTKTALPLGADEDGCMTAVAPTPEPVALENRIANYPVVPVFTQGQAIRLPIAHVQTASADATASALLEMGFSFTEIQKALSSCGVGVEKCVQFILHKGF